MYALLLPAKSTTQQTSGTSAANTPNDAGPNAPRLGFPSGLLAAREFDAKTEAPHSLLWLAAIQIVERKQNLPDLAPKDSFIATEAVEGIVGQIAEPQEATCELNIKNNLTLG
jgi:hypothetical protein